MCYCPEVEDGCMLVARRIEDWSRSEGGSNIGFTDLLHRSLLKEVQSVLFVEEGCWNKVIPLFQTYTRFILGQNKQVF